MLKTPDNIRELQRKLYRKAKQVKWRKPLEEDDWKVPPWREKTERTVVCPAKAGKFSRRQSCRGKSQSPRSLDGRR